MKDPIFIKIITRYNLKKPIIKAVMKWIKNPMMDEVSFDIDQLKYREKTSKDIGENTLEYSKAIEEVEKYATKRHTTIKE